MINALRYTEQLEEAGFTPEQAKNSVKIWMELMDGNFATKHDLDKLGFAMKEEFTAVRSEMKEEFTAVRSEMKDEFFAVHHEFSALRSEMKSMGDKLTIKLGGLMVAGIGIIGFMNKL